MRKYILILVLLAVVAQETYACCCNRIGGPKGCEQYDDWNACIMKPCDWLGNLKPPCEDSCWEHRMKESGGKMNEPKPEKKESKKKPKKAKKTDEL